MIRNSCKVVRLDVWAQNEREDILDIEVQDTNTGNLPKRSRYYQALIDCNLLEPGDTDYSSLNDVYIIMIASFDLFGKGRYQYTFKMTCQEEKDMLLQDHVVRIFLNTKGKDAENISDEMRTLLWYFENTKAEVIQGIGSVRLQRIHKHITKLRSSEEMRVKYMREWEEKAYAKAEGELKKQLDIARKMKESGEPIEKIALYTELTEEKIKEL